MHVSQCSVDGQVYRGRVTWLVIKPQDIVIDLGSEVQTVSVCRTVFRAGVAQFYQSGEVLRLAERLGERDVDALAVVAGKLRAHYRENAGGRDVDVEIVAGRESCVARFELDCQYFSLRIPLQTGGRERVFLPAGLLDFERRVSAPAEFQQFLRILDVNVFAQGQCSRSCRLSGVFISDFQ